MYNIKLIPSHPWWEYKNAAHAAKKLRDVYGEETLKEIRVEIGLIHKFHSGDFWLKGEQRSGWPNEVDDDQIKATHRKKISKIYRKFGTYLDNMTF